MAKVMNASEFVKKLIDVANNHKTLYVMGAYGGPLTSSNKTRYIKHHEYNSTSSRTNLIKKASTDTFGFDCVNLIKGILWGWTGDVNDKNGGAKYKSNGVVDTNADGMIKLCVNVSTDFTNMKVGEALWCKGHIGVYIGDGLAVESSPAWKNKVQITAVRNIGLKDGYNARTWTKHGELPYIEYDVTTKVTTKKTNTTKKPAKVIIAKAKYKDTTLSGSYKINTTALHIRAGVGTTATSLGTLPKGAVVKNYGFYNVDVRGTKWLYVKTEDGILGYCSTKYLKKC